MASRNQKIRAKLVKHPPNRLEVIRRGKGLSQTELGELCHTTKSTIARLEGQETGLDIETMRTLARALQVKPSEFLVDEDVEVRLPEPARAALDDLSSEELNMVVRAASDIARLVKRLSPTGHAAALKGDSAASVRMADIWNEMDTEEHARVLSIVEAARAFGHQPTIMAAE